jgi:hypothetical protein
MTTTIVQATTTASATLLGSIWVANGLLSTAGAAVAKKVSVRFLEQLLKMWGAPSSIGLQFLVEKLQLVGSGAFVAHPDMEGYRRTVQGLDWATIMWASEFTVVGYVQPRLIIQPCRLRPRS